MQTAPKPTEGAPGKAIPTPAILNALDDLDRARDALQLLRLAALGLHAEGMADESAAMQMGVEQIDSFLEAARSYLLPAKGGAE